MRLPGFGAQSSLYKTSGYYQMAGGFEHVDGITSQLIECGPCFWSDGKCVRNCTFCSRCPPGVKPNGCGGCTTTTEGCPTNEHCPPPPPPCCPAGCQGTC